MSGPWEVAQIDKTGRMVAKSHHNGIMAVAEVREKGTVKDAVPNGVVAIEDHGAIPTVRGDNTPNEDGSLTLAAAKSCLADTVQTKATSQQELKLAAASVNSIVKSMNHAKAAQQRAEELKRLALKPSHPRQCRTRRR
jgi:hypothetical protein